MMRLPRPASPRALWADIKTFASQWGPHHWIALVAALLIPAGILIVFTMDFEKRHERQPQMIYVESWRADRTPEETKANIEAVAARRKAAEEERRKSFQKIEEFNNKLGI